MLNVNLLQDGASTFSRGLAKDITTAADITIDKHVTPHLQNMSRLKATKADLAAAAKYARGNGYKVIVLAFRSYVELAVHALYDEGLYGDGIVIMGTTGSFFRSTRASFVGQNRIVLDASVMIARNGVDRSHKSSIAIMSQWPEGQAAFLANMNLAAYALDALNLLVHAIDSTIKNNKSPLNRTDLMSSLRTTSVQGLTGELKVATGWNNIRSRRFAIEMARVLHSPDTIGTVPGADSTGTSMVVEKIGVVYTDKSVLRLCSTGVPPGIGPACTKKAQPVSAVRAFGTSDTSLNVSWTTSVPASEMLKGGFKVSLSSGNDGDSDVVDTFPSTQTSKVYGLDRLAANVLYRVRVTALYDGGLVRALPTDCRDLSTCGGSLPCIPDITADKTCGCKDGEIHTMNLANGVPPEEWGCRKCLPGLKCLGGTAETTATAKGWFVGSTLGLVDPEGDVRHLQYKNTNDNQTPVLQNPLPPSLLKCPKDRSCPGGFQVSKLLPKKIKRGVRVTVKGPQSSGGVGTILGTALATAESLHGKVGIAKDQNADKTRWNVEFEANDGGNGGSSYTHIESLKPGNLVAETADIDGIFAQCAEGYTGMECAACLPGYSYTSCIKCPFTREDAIGVAVGIVLFIVAIASVVYILLKRASRPPLVERRFIVAFDEAEAEYGIGGSLRAFTETFGCTAEGGVGHDDFMRAFMPGGKLESVTASGGDVRAERVEGAALETLWEKLDENGDGSVSSVEFLDYFYNLKRGTHSTNPMRARMARLSNWYLSIRTQTIKVRPGMV